MDTAQWFTINVAVETGPCRYEHATLTRYCDSWLDAITLGEQYGKRRAIALGTPDAIVAVETED